MTNDYILQFILIGIGVGIAIIAWLLNRAIGQVDAIVEQHDRDIRQLQIAQATTQGALNDMKDDIDEIKADVKQLLRRGGAL